MSGLGEHETPPTLFSGFGDLGSVGVGKYPMVLGNHETTLREWFAKCSPADLKHQVQQAKSFHMFQNYQSQLRTKFGDDPVDDMVTFDLWIAKMTLSELERGGGDESTKATPTPITGATPASTTASDGSTIPGGTAASTTANDAPTIPAVIPASTTASDGSTIPGDTPASTNGAESKAGENSNHADASMGSVPATKVMGPPHPKTKKGPKPGEDESLPVLSPSEVAAYKGYWNKFSKAPSEKSVSSSPSPSLSTTAESSPASTSCRRMLDLEGRQ